ncbi:MAG: sel1 repeat family protein [Lachnospiraceae bacterium]|nr:sel1 repeat family protein [Lachnospiraceae bacterium]
MDFKNMPLNDIEEEGYRLYNSAGKDKELWKQCTDCFLYLIEHGVRENKKAQYGNTLGYIYYYGRTNDFKPEYDKAYKYFSIGAEGGFYESLYKLGDMYLNGYYVEKDPERAVQYYLQVYEEVEHQFRAEEFGGVFADISLRLGSLYRKGIGCRKDERKALFIYTMADYAIKERMKYENFFGNQKVADSITKELTELQEKFGVDVTKEIISADYPQVLPLVLTDGFSAFMTFKKKNNQVIITAERNRDFFIDDIYMTRVPVVFSEYGYVHFFWEVTEIAVDVTEFEITVPSDESYYVDEIRFDDKSGRYEFCCEGKIIAVIKAERFEFILDRTEEDE